MSHRAEGAAVAPTAEDTRDDSTLVAVVHKSHVNEDGSVTEGIERPGVVSLGWLRIGKNAENWIEIDQDTGKRRVTVGAADGTIDEVLARIDSGDVTAAAALAAETGEGGQNRTGLVTKLQALVGAGQEG